MAKSFLITGGAGTIGRQITRLLHVEDPATRIVIYNRDEGKQADMARELPEGGPVGIRYMLGDINDTDRLIHALRGITHVIHAAAIKMIDWADYNAWETIKTNVNGTLSVARACIKAGVNHAILLSTDKAADGPVGVYGQSKLLAETAFIDSNNYGDCRFNACRYGNVLYANKSVFYQWERQARSGDPITVTDDAVTRFYWSVSDAAHFVCCRAMGETDRGLIYIPKMRGVRLIDLARKYSDNIKITGFRCPEKLHEALWSVAESYRTYDREDYYVIHPHTHQWGAMVETGRPIPAGWKLTSNSEYEKIDYRKAVEEMVK